MGDARPDLKELENLQYRLDTFGNHKFNLLIGTLAAAGFYYTQKGEEVKCFACNLEVDTKSMNPTFDIVRLHKRERPDCHFAKNLTSPKPRSKKFIDYNSLRYEKERLETFIDWPVKWLHPDELASDGFYYLRTADHCACVFCRGIVGAWEMGDTPRGEHQRHFPHCPFIRGQPVANVPISHGNILARLPSQEEATQTRSTQRSGVDVCGTSRHMAGSYPECRGAPNKNNDVTLDEIGLPQYSGPKRKDFLTYESRLASYVKWPERVTQKTSDLADAGFFYCGLSDHVRCFHCGNGLRNWEKEDVPWNEHARWYPECNYVLLKKGQEFIDKVRRENPPFIRTQPQAQPSTSTTNPSSSSITSTGSRRINDRDLDHLMDLDIIRGVLGMGFPTHTVRAALRSHVEQTGMPFFSMEPCIEAVLQRMEEETRQTLHGPSEDIESEATERQVAKIQAIHSGSETSSTEATSSSSSTAPSSSHTSETQARSSSAVPSTTSASTSVSEDTTGTLPTLPSGSTSSSNSTALPTLPPGSPASSNSTALPILPAPNSTAATTARTIPAPQVPTSEVPENTSPVSSQTSSATDEQMEVDETGPAAPQQSESRRNQVEQVIMQADEVMSMAEEALKPPTSGPPSLGRSDLKVVGEGEGSQQMDQESSSGTKHQPGEVSSPQSSKELAEELERIRDSRTCKVCMDGEMDVVFLPCAHMVACASCAVALTQCPICRKDIKYTIKPIVS